MTHYVFEEIKYTATKTVVVDGKRRKRQRTFTATLNPWNVNAAGETCTRAEAMDKLRAKAARWMEPPVEVER